MRASNAIYDVDEGRPVWKTAPVRLVTTVALFVMLVIAAAIVVLTGPIANQVGTPSRRAVSHYRFRRQTSGKGRAPQRLETRMIMNDTTGKPLAVVTGASSGIGGELAARFAEHG